MNRRIQKVRTLGYRVFQELEVQMGNKKYKNGLILNAKLECPPGHLPKKLVYGDGNERVIPEPKCSECGYRIKTKATRTKTTLTSVYTCTGCGKVERDKISLKPKVLKPINEKDRLKYCSASPSLRTIMEGLNDIYKLKPILEKSAEQNKYQLCRINISYKK